MILPLILYVIISSIYTYLLYWIWKLEKTGCACSKDWRRDFIMYWMIIYTLFVLLPIILIKYGMKRLAQVISMIMFILGLIFIVVVFQYVRKLKEIKCKCADGTELKVLEIFNYVQIGLMATGYGNSAIGLGLATSVVGSGIFSALIAVDTHLAIKSYRDGELDSTGIALNVLLDVTNLFLDLLRIIGEISKGFNNND